jgi:hypothetical protein
MCYLLLSGAYLHVDKGQDCAPWHADLRKWNRAARRREESMSDLASSMLGTLNTFYISCCVFMDVIYTEFS